MTTLVDICDAIANDLTTLATSIAPGYTDWRHTRPDMLTSEHAPWLLVYSPTTDHTLETTYGDYMDADQIDVEWAVPISDAVEAGGDPEKIKAAIIAATPIVTKLRTYTEGLPTIGNQFVATLLTTTRDTSIDLVWRQTTRLAITSAGAE